MARGCIRREVNLLNEFFGGTMSVPHSYPSPYIALVKLDPADFSGTVTMALEIVAKNRHSSANYEVHVREDATTYGGYSNTQSIVTIPANTNSWTRFRSSFSPLDAINIYKLLLKYGGLETDIIVARIIIIQSGADTTDIYKTIGQFEVGARESVITTGTTTEPLTNPKFVYFDPNNYDQVLDGYASVVAEGPSTKGTSGGSIIKLQRTTDFVTWVDGPTIVSGAIGGGDGAPYAFFDTTFPSTALTAPGSSTHPTWWRLALVPTQKDGFGILVAKMGVRQDGGSTSSGITKTEDQYLMINNPPAASGLSEFYTYFDPSTDEWESIANEYYHQIDCSTRTSQAHLSSSGNTLPGSKVLGIRSIDHGSFDIYTIGSSVEANVFFLTAAQGVSQYEAMSQTFISAGGLIKGFDYYVVAIIGAPSDLYARLYLKDAGSSKPTGAALTNVNLGVLGSSGWSFAEFSPGYQSTAVGAEYCMVLEHNFGSTSNCYVVGSMFPGRGQMAGSTDVGTTDWNLHAGSWLSVNPVEELAMPAGSGELDCFIDVLG